MATRNPRGRERLKTSKANFWRITMHGWTPERQQRQSEAIRQWRPWERSTGPKTPEGKAISARRGYKGDWRGELRAMRKALREQQEALRRLPMG
ncbi:hypothetical protein CCP4SC76_2490004 [Gammaproteobacteria bacterium]